KLSSIGTLASGTAHQINNPLNNIATSCQLALAETDAEQCPFVMQMLKTIDQETQRAGEIVRELLEFSRAQTFSMKEVQLKTVVDKVMHLVASEVPAGITVEHNVPENFTLNLDVQKMVEALLNLIINSVQAIEIPPGRVDIRAVAKDNQAIITIRDTGVGIKVENLQKVFDPFFTTKDEGNGTGLGLAVVYGIIQKHNGTIQVKSEKGKGTQFVITLPFAHKPHVVTS
ncbi:MAG: GHKL domain-containing protein, partial [Deltaproteobacteria bacterium]|nr:GHKL domain-containing protein [Deltaproteobacteria bacterium]